jgi:hypothetical protein
MYVVIIHDHFSMELMEKHTQVNPTTILVGQPGTCLDHVSEPLTPSIQMQGKHEEEDKTMDTGSGLAARGCARHGQPAVGQIATKPQLATNP